MACIDCGLAMNGDGKGRVDLDTNGGLECLGAGDSGTVNGPGTGLKIKKDATAGNSVELSDEGLYIPRASSFQVVTSTEAGSGIVDPGFVGGGTPAVTPTVSVLLSNTGTSPKTFVYQASIDWSTGDASAGFWFTLNTQEAGGGWFPEGTTVLPADTVFSPMLGRPKAIIVPAGESRQVDAQMVVYTGHVSNWRVSIAAWGDFSD